MDGAALTRGVAASSATRRPHDISGMVVDGMAEFRWASKAATTSSQRARRTRYLTHFQFSERAPSRSVPSPGLDSLAVELVQPALLLQRLAGLGDVVRERRDQRVAQGQLDEGPHDLHVIRVGGKCVGGNHPAPFRRKLRRDVELVVVVLLGELEGDQ